MLTQQEFDLFLRAVNALEQIAKTQTEQTEIARASAARRAIHDARLSEMSEKLTQFAAGFAAQDPRTMPAAPFEAPPRPLKRAGALLEENPLIEPESERPQEDTKS